MPIYVKTSGENTTTSWQELTSIDGSSSEDIYVRVDSGSGSINKRIESVYVRTDTGWVEVHKAFVMPPPVAPSAPVLNVASGWNTRIDQTKLSWTIPTNTTSFQLTTYNDSGGTIDIQNFSSSTTSATLDIDPGGSAQRYRIKAANTNSVGTAWSPNSNGIRVVPGKTNQSFTVSHPYQTWLFSQSSTISGCNIGTTWAITKTGNSSDPNVAGYVEVQRVQYGLEYYGYQVYALASSSRSLQFSSPGYAFNYPTSATVPKYEDISVSGAGGGTYQLIASGTGWSSRESNCTLRIFNGASASIKGTYFRIVGVETTSNSWSSFT